MKLYYLNDDEIEFSITTISKKIENVDKIFEDYYKRKFFKKLVLVWIKIVKDICDKNLVIINIDSNEKETKFTYKFKINEDTTSWRWVIAK